MWCCEVNFSVFQHVLSFLQGSPGDLLAASHVSPGFRCQCLDELFFKELCTRGWAESAALLPFYGDSWRQLYLEGTSKVIPRQVQAHAVRRLARLKATFATDTDATAHLRDRRTFYEGQLNTVLNQVSVDRADVAAKTEQVRELLARARREEERDGQSALHLFCLHHFALRLTHVGRAVVAHHAATAYAFAGLAVGLCVDEPRLARLVLLHFYNACPFTLPYHPTLPGDAVRRRWFRTEGGEGALELDQQSMSGLVTLYAAFVQTEPPKGKRHPYGLRHGCAWLVRMLHEPRHLHSISALFHFCSTASFALIKNEPLFYQGFLEQIREWTHADEEQGSDSTEASSQPGQCGQYMCPGSGDVSIRAVGVRLETVVANAAAALAGTRGLEAPAGWSLDISDRPSILCPADPAQPQRPTTRIIT
ncbi:uncharacterized protein ACA1_378490 [Acanthamoeba castellanii str. Neff]|uniref:mRNA export factor GLE1 n=1 Tax=Acanthamoeba castellanii (strain ATCC 30010 / Neff) TaxID=1257118 RepID=L8GRV6_ACACF|nr:uncharacterized protein ACA1_378490 [Acanthamoeba castellanii str. Neff]ELR15710.1 hypothetical protein ACA1_378490 [Acanthamoeba castellanii str. Neff]